MPQATWFRCIWRLAQDSASRMIEVLVEPHGARVPIEPAALDGVVSHTFMRHGDDG